MITNFYDDIEKGKIGEEIFKTDYLDYNNIKYADVRKQPEYQKQDIDFVTRYYTYEVKTNYKDNQYLILEEYTNCNKDLGPITYGWLSKSQADRLVFVSKETRTMIFLNFSETFKECYLEIRNNYQLVKNRITDFQNGNKRQGAYRQIYLNDLKAFTKEYKKN